ncbi:MAG: parvulin-like peptidyl-prolyl isomerase [Gammaproteobacteria bacterium]|jgi:parvulin-like peptidyl-prolyl isomerase
MVPREGTRGPPVLRQICAAIVGPLWLFGSSDRAAIVARVTHVARFQGSISRSTASVALVAVLTAGCGSGAPGSADGSPIVATVANVPITVSELQGEMAHRARRPGQFNTSQARAALLDDLIGFQALLARARTEGYDRDPEMRARFERMLVDKLRETRLEPELAAVSVSDDDIATYYEAHRNDYSTPAQVRAAVIRVGVPVRGTPAVRALRVARIGDARTQALALPAGSRGFGAVAVQHSDHRASRYLGGDVGWLAEGVASDAWPPAVVAAAFALSGSDEVSDVLEADGARFLVKQIARKPPAVQPLERVKATIHRHLLKAKRKASEERWHAQIRAETEIDINTAALAALPALPAPPPSPGRAESAHGTGNGTRAGPPGLPRS